MKAPHRLIKTQVEYVSFAAACRIPANPYAILLGAGRGRILNFLDRFQVITFLSTKGRLAAPLLCNALLVRLNDSFGSGSTAVFEKRTQRRYAIELVMPYAKSSATSTDGLECLAAGLDVRTAFCRATKAGYYARRLLDNIYTLLPPKRYAHMVGTAGQLI